MAMADTRLDYLRRLETQTWNREIARLKLLTPDATPGAWIADAFRYLVDNTCFLDLCRRLETRFDRQFDAALKTFRQQQAWCRARVPNKVQSRSNRVLLPAMGQSQRPKGHPCSFNPLLIGVLLPAGKTF